MAQQHPSAYSCPTCGHGDPNAYLRCNHPMCPDGRDQARFQIYRDTYDPDEPNPFRKPTVWHRLGQAAAWLAVILVMAWLFSR